MTNRLIDKLNQYFNNSQNLNMEQMEEFVHETLRYFDQLRTTLTKGTDEEKKQAMKEAQEMQEKLQEVAKKAYDKLGMDQEQINKVLSQGAFPKDQMKHFHSAQQEIDEYKKTVSKGKSV